MARPKKPVDMDQLRKLAKMQCTLEEIASWFGISISTCSHRFRSEIAQAREGGKISLRRLQWKRARAGSDTMIIHMSQHSLNQHNHVKADVAIARRRIVEEAQRRAAERESRMKQEQENRHETD